MEKRIIIAGSGGQGVLFFGKVLAYAAMIEKREVTCFPSYGAEMRGGSANCTVIVSDNMIGSPVIGNPDMLVVMNDISYNRFIGQLLPGGILVCDSSIISLDIVRNDITVVKVPATSISFSLHAPKAVNMAMLGAFIAATGLLDIESVIHAIDEITPEHRKSSMSVNKDVIMKGFNSIINKGDRVAEKTPSCN